MDVQQQLQKIIEDNLLKAKAIFSLYPANSSGDDIEVYSPQGKRQAVFHTLRQQSKKIKQAPNLALADYIAPKESGLRDYTRMFCSYNWSRNRKIDKRI